MKRARGSSEEAAETMGKEEPVSEESCTTVSEEDGSETGLISSQSVGDQKDEEQGTRREYSS